MRFESIEDFEPTQVVNQVAPLRALLEARTRLADLRSSLNDKLEDLLQEAIHSTASLQKLFMELEELEEEEPAYGLFEQIVQEVFSYSADERESGKAWLHEFLMRVASGEISVSKDTESMLTACIIEMDAKLSVQLNEIMHAPEFQQLEASWRGLEYLISRTETSPLLKIRVLNVSKEDLRKDQERAAEFDQSALFKKVYDESYGTFGAAPYGALIGDYYFGRHPPDINLLERISNVAAAAHAPFIAAADSSLFNLDGFTELCMPRDLAKIFDTRDYAKWKSFRETEDSRYVGLALPRVLLRLPYGKNTVPVESFDYDECVDGRDHSKYLWGNAAYAFAACLTKAFHRYGWCAAIRGSETGGLVRDLTFHSFVTDDGDVTVECPTEVAISDRREAELAALGFIALCHNKRSDMATFFDAPSCAKPKKYDNDKANVMARFSVQLEFILAVSRFAHYIKVMMRDKVGSFLPRPDAEKFLNAWIAQYVVQANDSPGEEKARFPLRYARVAVAEVPGRPGCYRAGMFLQPQFQLDHLTVPLKLVTELPSPASK